MSTSPRPRPDLAPRSGATSPGDLAPTPPTLRVGAKSRGELGDTHANNLTSPQGRSHNSLVGPRSQPAWDALLDYLSDGQWHPLENARELMLQSSDLSTRTVDNYLVRAGRRGWITRRRGQVRLRDPQLLDAALSALDPMDDSQIGGPHG